MESDTGSTYSHLFCVDTVADMPPVYEALVADDTFLDYLATEGRDDGMSMSQNSL